MIVILGNISLPITWVGVNVLIRLAEYFLKWDSNI